MYAFGMMALLGLAVLAVVKIVNRYVSIATELWAFVVVGLGVGAAWLVDLNLFSVWGIPVRNSEIAVTVTGLIIAGVAYFWREVLGLFNGLSRKAADEAETLERAAHLRRVA
jgi:hypothetical protein